MHVEQYLFLLIPICGHILTTFLCIDQLHYNLIYKILFGLNLLNHFFNSLFPHCLEKKQNFMVIVVIPFFSCDLNPSESILIASLDGSISIHLHINQGAGYNSCLSNRFV